MIEVLKLALKALNAGEHAHLIMNTDGIKDKVRQAIAELESQEPVAWVDLQKEAQQIVESKILWKRFIDGTPLANDIACWMADFVQQYTHPPQRTWVGLTDDEVEGYWDWEDFQTGAGRLTIFEMVRDIEAKLKEKNNA